MQRLFVFISILALMLVGCSGPSPVAVNLTAPADGSTVPSVTPVLSWSGITADTVYRLAIATDSNFQGLVVDANNLSIVNYTVPSGKLNGSAQYYWRVQPSQGAMLPIGLPPGLSAHRAPARLAQAAYAFRPHWTARPGTVL